MRNRCSWTGPKWLNTQLSEWENWIVSSLQQFALVSHIPLVTRTFLCSRRSLNVDLFCFETVHQCIRPKHILCFITVKFVLMLRDANHHEEDNRELRSHEVALTSFTLILMFYQHFVTWQTHLALRKIYVSFYTTLDPKLLRLTSINRLSYPTPFGRLIVASRKVPCVL